jgi:hypothetical protein
MQAGAKGAKTKNSHKERKRTQRFSFVLFVFFVAILLTAKAGRRASHPNPTFIAAQSRVKFKR